MNDLKKKKSMKFFIEGFLEGDSPDCDLVLIFDYFINAITCFTLS